MTESDREHPRHPRHWERPWVRSVPVKSMFRPPEYADLEAIAEGWGVPPATAAYAMVATFLSGCRQRSLDLGPAGLKIAASSRILAAQGIHAQSQPPQDR